MGTIDIGYGKSLAINTTNANTSIPLGTVSVQGNVTGGNLVTSGTLRVNSVLANTIITTGNIAGGNLTVSRLTSTGTITGGNLAVGSGFISGGNIISAGPISAGGTITAPSLNITGGLTLPSFSTAGNITGGNILTSGNMSTTGNNISGGNVAGLNLSTLNATGVINGGSLSVYGSVQSATVSASGNVRAGAFLNTNGSPYQSPGGPAFIATITTSTSIPASPNLPIAELPITFNNVIKNISNGYSNGIFTAPTAGFYQVSAAFAPGVPSPPGNPSLYYGAAALGIYKNNSPIASGPFVEGKSRSWGSVTGWVIDASSVSTLVYLNIGDTLQCKLAYITNYSGFTTLPNIVAPYFQACWLRS